MADNPIAAAREELHREQAALEAAEQAGADLATLNGLRARVRLADIRYQDVSRGVALAQEQAAREHAQEATAGVNLNSARSWAVRMALEDKFGYGNVTDDMLRSVLAGLDEEGGS